MTSTLLTEHLLFIANLAKQTASKLTKFLQPSITDLCISFSCVQTCKTYKVNIDHEKRKWAPEQRVKNSTFETFCKILKQSHPFLIFCEYNIDNINVVVGCISKLSLA